MSIVGHFKYHIYEIKLEVSDDEKVYTVTLTQGSLRQLSDPSIESEIVIHPFNNLSLARTAFENGVHNVMFKTSITDVSLYGQHS